MTIYRTIPSVREAGEADHAVLARFLNHETRVHRHLDWRNSLDWLGKHPFLIAQQNRQIEAIFASPVEPPHYAWIRLFAASGNLSTDYYFRTLLGAAREELSATRDNFAAIGLQHWFQNVLVASGFVNRQNIAVLERESPLPPEIPLSPDVVIREMDRSDLPIVARLDQIAFEPLWHNPIEALTLAFNQSGWSTVAEIDGEIVGYQISTAAPLSAHLARLAVLPRLQRGHIGYALVRELLTHFQKVGAWRVTVNTQDTNASSLALYAKMGFQHTGETFPVYELPEQ